MYKTILFIEDDTALASIYSKVLKDNGFEVNCAYEGDSGLEIAQTRPYDLILLDLMLPNRSGMDILRMLRNPQKSPRFNQATDIIILTNFEVDDLMKKEIMTMAKSYLLKVDTTPKLLSTMLKGMAEPQLA